MTTYKVFKTKNKIKFNSSMIKASLDTDYPSLKWGLGNPPKPHAYESLPTQSSFFSKIKLSFSRIYNGITLAKIIITVVVITVIILLKHSYFGWDYTLCTIEDFFIIGIPGFIGRLIHPGLGKFLDILGCNYSLPEISRKIRLGRKTPLGGQGSAHYYKSSEFKLNVLSKNADKPEDSNKEVGVVERPQTSLDNSTDSISNTDSTDSGGPKIIEYKQKKINDLTKAVAIAKEDLLDAEAVSDKWSPEHLNTLRARVTKRELILKLEIVIQNRAGAQNQQAMEEIKQLAACYAIRVQYIEDGAKGRVVPNE